MTSHPEQRNVSKFERDEKKRTTQIKLTRPGLSQQI